MSVKNDVLEMWEYGATVSEIAHSLDISIFTVNQIIKFERIKYHDFFQKTFRKSSNSEKSN